MTRYRKCTRCTKMYAIKGHIPYGFRKCPGCLKSICTKCYDPTPGDAFCGVECEAIGRLQGMDADPRDAFQLASWAGGVERFDED